MPLDPLLTLAVIGLGICSVVTLQRRHPQPASPATPATTRPARGSTSAIGLVAMVALSRLDYSHLRRLKGPIYAVLILSILAVLGAGHSSNGAQRAINFPFFSFQASELGKVLLIVALAACWWTARGRCATATRPPA